MRMTIDEIIKEMEEEYAIFLEGTGLDDSLRMERERKNNPDCDKVCTANEMTLDILRKYQKIEQIMDELNGDFYGSYLKDRQVLEKIYEVLKDGNEQSTEKITTENK